MFVKKEFRGKEHGIAQRLLNTLEESARTNTIKSLYLGTLERLEAAIRFYERNGFSVIGTRDFVVGGEVHVDPVYARGL